MFTIHCLEIVAEAKTPISLDKYCGSALRGAFFRAIWGRFCTNRESPTCRECPLIMACPVASLVAPLRDEGNSGQDIPRPYVISPPNKEPNRYEQGESFTFSLSLVGTSTNLFPYVIRSFQEMEKATIGHPLPELRGRRGQFRILEIRAYHPLTGERQVLWQKDDVRPQKPQLCVTSIDITKHAQELPTDKVTIHFLSPTRLIFEERLVKSPSFRILALRLAERIRALQNAYSNATQDKGAENLDTLPNYRDWHKQIDTYASAVHLVNDETHWEDIKSYSGAQKKTTPIGGFVGKASYSGDLTHLRELLLWGEILHVGKNVVKGNGMYHIEDSCKL
jgi:CRISPR-associated endoribonuclease Cas6